METNYDKSYWKDDGCPKYDCRKNSCKCGLKSVFLPSALGDDSEGSSIAPKNGAYCNAIVAYEANGNVYIYSKEGIPTLVERDTKNLEKVVAKEILDRQAADNTLQGEIDAIKNSPDVVDIVDTYADLQAYDTSHLGDKDVIRVLTDETHDGASSYYRWDKQTETWAYIGSIQTAANTIFYADLSETGNTRHIYKNSDMTGTVSVQELLDVNEDGQVILRMSSAQTPENFNDAYLQNTYVGVDDYQFLFLDNRNYYEYDGTATTDTSYYYSKSTIQLELTAGNNITITGDTISATDTTYSNFTGTDGVDAGTAGLVPAPATTDVDKFLKSDGTWATAGGGSGPTVVQTTGTSQSDVMSQNAVTSTIFADPGTNKQISIGNVSSQIGNRAVGIGDGCAASGSVSVAIGVGNASGAQSIAIGSSARALNTDAIAIGRGASSASGAITIGGHSFADPNEGATGRGSIALGYGAKTTKQGEINVSTDDQNFGYNSTNYRLLSGIYDGQSAHDAATLVQGNTLSTSAPDTSTVGVLGQLYTDTTTMHTYQCTAIDTTDPSNPSYTWQMRW